jgi:hypothetical protein
MIWVNLSWQKSDYSGDSSAEIVTTIAPSTLTGGALKVTNIGGADASYRPAWWIEITGGNLGTQLRAADTDNRMEFYIYNSGIAMETTGYTTWQNIENFNSEFGTYTCDSTECVDLGGDGEGGYDEGWHYYHQLNFSNDIWWHVSLGSAPEHYRDPRDEVVADLTSYYYYMSGFYLEHSTATSGAYFIIDEVELKTVTDENDISTGSIEVGYNPSTEKWQFVWHDNSFLVYNDYSNSTFDIRWSLSPITNANFEAANKITPEYFPVDTYLVRRGEPYARTGWTQFTLAEVTSGTVYFAIKDVSVSGGHIGGYPNGYGDGHDAISSLIRTIDYALSQAAVVYKRPSLGGKMPSVGGKIPALAQ